MVNPALSEGLPPFLAPGAGLNSGFMMPQVTAAALVSENKVLAHPASVDSITTSGNKEDYVSMGMGAAIKLKKIVENTRNALAIEAMAAAQALDLLAPLKSSKRLQLAHSAIRAVSAKFEKDRVMYQDFARIADVIASGKVGHELKAERRKRKDASTAILFLDQLYPLPRTEILAALEAHPHAREVVWVQEEPRNMGPFSYVMPRLQQLVQERSLSLRSVKRSSSASPATGSAKAHEMEQKTLLSLAFTTTSGG